MLLPPVGLMYIWRRRLFYARGRVLLTVLATLEMAIAVTFFLPRVRIAPTLPVPQETVRFTPSPQSDVQTALDSLDELLQSRQVAAAPEGTFLQHIPEDGVAAKSIECSDFIMRKLAVHRLRGKAAAFVGCLILLNGHAQRPSFSAT